MTFSQQPLTGKFIWHDLIPEDVTSAPDFYQSIAGYKAETIARRGGQYTMMSASGVNRAGILRNPTEHWGPLWLSYFGVAEPSRAVLVLQKLPQ